MLRSFWLVDTPGEKVWPHKMSFDIVSSLAFLFPLLESPLVIVFPYLRKQFSHTFQENGLVVVDIGRSSMNSCLSFTDVSFLIRYF